MSTITDLQATDSGATSRTIINDNFDNLNNDKAEASTVTAHTSATTNVHGVTGSFVGLTMTQTLTNKTLTSPTITSPTVTGTVAGSATLTTMTINGSQNSMTVREQELVFTDVTTNNASTTKHGLLPKLSNSASQFLDGTGSWSSPSSLPKVKVYTTFETSARFTANLASTTTTYNSNGLTLATDGSGNKGGWVTFAIAGSNMSLYSAGSVFTASFSLNAVNSAGQVYIGIGEGISAGGGSVGTTKHVGFVVNIDSSVASLYGTVANGSAETRTSALTTLSANDALSVLAIINSSTSVDFYWRKNGGTLSSATNVTTNIPTGTERLLSFGISDENTAVVASATAAGMGYEI